MVEQGYIGANGEANVFKKIADSLSELTSCFFVNIPCDKASILKVEATAKEFSDRMQKLDDDKKKALVDALTDLFIDDYISFTEMNNKVKALIDDKCIDEIILFTNYEEGLPARHRKAFIKAKVGVLKTQYQKAYEVLGKEMVNIDHDEAYSKALICHMILSRSISDYESILEYLAKKRCDLDFAEYNIFQTAIVTIKMVAFIQNKISLDDLQGTYSKILTGDPVCRFIDDAGEVITN